MIKCEFENGNIADPGLRHITTGVLVLKDRKLLLAKRAEGLLEAGKWCLIGGFLDRNETIAEGARREVREETGWEIGKLTLLHINDNPDRPHEDRQNVDFVFFTDATEQTGQPDQETAAMEWYDLNKLPPEGEIAFDHAKNIQLYKDYLDKEFPLPVIYGNS